MKNALLLCAALFANIVLGQEKMPGVNISKTHAGSTCICCGKSDTETPAIIDGKKIRYGKYVFLNTDNIKTMTVHKGDTAEKLFGEPVKEGLIVMETKRPVKLLSAKDLVEIYNLNPDLHIVVNKTLIADKTKLLVEKNSILKVETLEESPFVEPKIPHMPGEKMIYITFKN